MGDEQAFNSRPGYHRWKHSHQSTSTPMHSQQVFNQATAIAKQAQLLFDGKRMRKNIQRRTVDYNSTIIKQMEWTPEGRRLVTGSASGEFTLWNGLTFNFETILQAHDSAVRSMIWSHNDTWMITADHAGTIKYWQSNMNNLQAFQGHNNVIRDLTFSPTDIKLASCSDDATIKIWDFARQTEERVMKEHLWDVKSIDWHPTKGLLASGSKDHIVKLWDPKTGKALCSLHGHNGPISSVQWNLNGNWLVSASRDQMLRVFDIRTMKEFQTFRGHKKEVSSVAWHPQHESLLVSGGSDGSIMYWMCGTEHSIGGVENAHEMHIFALDWHPLGHILVSGSNDHTTRFWTRNRPGDNVLDRFNLSRKEAEALGIEHTQDLEMEEEEEEDTGMLPGLGGQFRTHHIDSSGGIPGLGGGLSNPSAINDSDVGTMDKSRAERLMGFSSGNDDRRNSPRGRDGERRRERDYDRGDRGDRGRGGSGGRRGRGGRERNDRSHENSPDRRGNRSGRGREEHNKRQRQYSNSPPPPSGQSTSTASMLPGPAGSTSANFSAMPPEIKQQILQQLAARVITIPPIAILPSTKHHISRNQTAKQLSTKLQRASVILHGPRGCGKSFAVTKYVKDLEKKRDEQVVWIIVDSEEVDLKSQKKYANWTCTISDFLRDEVDDPQIRQLRESVQHASLIVFDNVTNFALIIDMVKQHMESETKKMLLVMTDPLRKDEITAGNFRFVEMSFPAEDSCLEYLLNFPAKSRELSNEDCRKLVLGANNNPSQLATAAKFLFKNPTIPVKQYIFENLFALDVKIPSHALMLLLSDLNPFGILLDAVYYSLLAALAESEIQFFRKALVGKELNETVYDKIVQDLKDLGLLKGSGMLVWIETNMQATLREGVVNGMLEDQCELFAQRYYHLLNDANKLSEEIKLGSWEIVAAMIGCMSRINLMDTIVVDKASNIIAQSMAASTSRLSVLDLWHTHLGDNGAKSIGLALSVNACLRVLSLQS
ncbi:hypothetical protein HK098_001072 [Nowakowskiella sp. JEL0407]|nr:hypothetical protein HK098_001072 [Nowakowskiella sp. JEL0407]